MARGDEAAADDRADGTSTATIRQNVSFRRIRRRSTMKSASLDMALFPQIDSKRS